MTSSAIKTNVGFTEAAIAGLAAKEDFSAIKLKRTRSHTHLGQYAPFNDFMLLQIKGNLIILMAFDKKNSIQINLRPKILPNKTS